MKQGLTLLILVLAVFTQSFAQNSERNACGDYLKMKKEIDNAVQVIAVDHAKDHLFLSKFKSAQIAWENYKDTQLEMIFPEADKLKEYGSMYSTCRCSWLLQFANERLDYLLKWSSNTNNEEDACNGSMNSLKRKSHIKFNE